jgi:hypothetical protein
MSGSEAVLPQFVQYSDSQSLYLNDRPISIASGRV